MKNSTNPPNLDTIRKAIDCTLRWYVSNGSKSYHFLKNLKLKWVAFFLKHHPVYHVVSITYVEHFMGMLLNFAVYFGSLPVNL